MNKLKVANFSLSVDGYAAGPGQDVDHPLGVGGHALHEWAFATRTFQRMHGAEGGTTGIDDDFAARGFENVGAWIIGRNMFGPLRGAWQDDKWQGWWGDDPPFHTPVFVLSHHPRPSISMKGGTTFHFATAGIDDALRRAEAAAKGKDIRLGGGVTTIRQYLLAGLIDELHIAMAPTLLGSGESLLTGIDLVKLGYRCERHVSTPSATHLIIISNGSSEPITNPHQGDFLADLSGA